MKTACILQNCNIAVKCTQLLFCQISSRKEKHMLKYREGKQCKQNAMSEDGINERRNERRNEKNLIKRA